MMQKMVQQAVNEAVENAHRLGFLDAPKQQQTSLTPSSNNSLQSNITADQSKVTPMSTLLDEINQLAIAERIQLVEDLWDSVATRSSELPISETQKAELDRRLAKHHSNPQRGISLGQIAQKLGVTL